MASYSLLKGANFKLRVRMRVTETPHANLLEEEDIRAATKKFVEAVTVRIARGEDKKGQDLGYAERQVFIPVTGVGSGSRKMIPRGKPSTHRMSKGRTVRFVDYRDFKETSGGTGRRDLFAGGTLLEEMGSRLSVSKNRREFFISWKRKIHRDIIRSHPKNQELIEPSEKEMRVLRDELATAIVGRLRAAGWDVEE